MSTTVKKTKKDYKLWRELEVKSWNSTTYRAYLTDMHRELYNTEYIVNSIKNENMMISNLVKNFGKETVKDFFDLCLANWKPTTTYKNCTVYFMTMYMKERFLPMAIDNRRSEEVVNTAVYEQQAIDYDTIY